MSDIHAEQHNGTRPADDGRLDRATITELDDRGARIPFARDHANQTLPASWASEMLIRWREQDPEGWGWELARLTTGVDPKSRKKPAR